MRVHACVSQSEQIEGGQPNQVDSIPTRALAADWLVVGRRLRRDFCPHGMETFITYKTSAIICHEESQRCLGYVLLQALRPISGFRDARTPPCLPPSPSFLPPSPQRAVLSTGIEMCQER